MRLGCTIMALITAVICWGTTEPEADDSTTITAVIVEDTPIVEDIVIVEDTLIVEMIDDSLVTRLTGMATAALMPDSLPRDTTAADSLIAGKKKSKHRHKKERTDWSTWRPNPQRALWLALVLPGAGQIYNRKYWKLPIFYGGFMGCIYAMTWNNMMYKDYSQAYLDIMDDDPTTESYNKFLHLGKQITSSNESRYKKLFKSRKDRYRRWRDLSFFVLVGVYALSVIDAYVDAELSEFDISRDLSMRVQPTINVTAPSGSQNTGTYYGAVPIGTSINDSNIGLQCSIRF